jgi:uncharacterized protein YcfJ
MRVLSFVLFAVTLLLVGGGSSWAAADSTSCDAMISKLKEGTTLQIISRNQQRFAGQLVALDSEQRILQLTTEDALGDYTREIPYDAIREIRYASRGHVQAGYVFWGLLIGAAAGALIGNTVDSGKELEDDSGGAATGAAIGAGFGILVGGGISLFIPSQHKIDCKKPE